MTTSAKCLLIGLMLLARTSGFAQMLESFEEVPIGSMPPAGWRKWEEAGGRGWSNSFAGRMPMPGWMSGTNTVPPDPAGGSRLAYVTYTHGGAKTNDLWLISPTLKGITATSSVSFWYRSSFSNFADNIYVHISTNPSAYRKSDFTIEAYHAYFPRGYPGPAGVRGMDFPEWTNIVINIGSLVPPGTDIRLGFREYHQNNWYDVRANEMDVIRTDLWAPPVVSTITARVISPTTIAVDYYAFGGYPTGSCGIAWGPGPTPEIAHNSIYVSQGSGTCVISNFPNNQACSVRAFVKHSRGIYYGNDITIQAGDSNGEGFLLESFEDVPIGQMPPAGWRKWEEAGGRGWSNSYAGRIPMPGWMSGTNTTPPDPDGGSRLAYVTYTHGGAKTNDLWLISPTIRNVPSNCPVSFWYRSSFSNFADNIYLNVSTKTNAYRKSDFTIEAFHANFPRGYPGPAGVNKQDYPEWTNIVVDIGPLVPAGSDVRLGFREYHNNNWYDVRANEMDAIRVGSRVRNALSFDGSDDYVVLPLTTDPTQYTIEAWIKRVDTTAGSIIVRTDGNPLISRSHQLRITAAGLAEHYLYDGADKTVAGTTTIETGRWYHIAGTAKNGGVMRLFVNGVEEGAAAAVGTMWIGGNEYRVGDATAAPYGAFNGVIDEVRVWNQERGAGDILDTMNIYLRGVETGLEACYRFDSTWGSDLFDSSQGGHDTWFGPATESYAWTHQAQNYDGVDDYTVIPQSSTPPDYTIEAWVRPDRTNIQQNILVFTAGDPLTIWNRQLRINSSGRFEYFSYDFSVRLVTGTTIAQAGHWYHVAGTAQNGGTMRLYVNGIEENFGPSGNTLWGSGNQYQIAAATGGGSTWFKGRIRDVGITNRVKTGTELLATVTNMSSCDTNRMPTWVEAETPLGDYVAAENWNNRGLWTERGDASPTNGLAVSSSVSGITNFMVFGHNNLRDAKATELPAGFAGSRLSRVWYADVHGRTNPVADLSFTPSQVGSSNWYIPGGDYALLGRSGRSGAFSIQKSAADTVTGGNVNFTNVALSEGYYTIGLAVPSAPNVLSATGITARAFWANWDASANATNYWLDVASNAAFTVYVPGFQNLMMGDKLTAAVTGLLPGRIYYYRLRAEHAGGVSTNSATVSVTTLTEGAIGVSSSVVNFATQYGADPAPQLISITNSGQTLYLFTNTVGYSSEASAWLSVVPIDGAMGALTSALQTLTVSATGINAGVYSATNYINSPTATNSPQSWVAILTVNKADQSISFPAIAAQETTNTIGLSASSSSGLPVTFAVVSGPASISGGTNLSFSGAGSVSIAASQSGNTNWNAAANVTNTFNVTKATASVTLNNLTQTYDGTPRAVTATTVPAGLTVDITYDGSSSAPTNSGSYAIAAVVNEVMYQGSESGTLIVNKADQTITFAPIADQPIQNTVGLSATATSGFDVSFSLNLGPGILSDATNLSFSATGVVSIVASQAGNTNWNAAPDFTNTFNVYDDVVPAILGCPSDISLTNDSEICTTIATWTSPTATDNWAVAWFTNNYESGDTFSAGISTVIYVAMDQAGNSSTCSFDVIVYDVEAPSISGCPSDISTTNIPGACAAVVTWPAPTADDNCAVDSFTNNFSSGDSFNVGTTTVEYVAADVAGNSATCSFNVVVSDVEDPFISGCPADIAITNDPGNCSAAVTWTAPTADDNCGVASFTSTDDPGDVFNVGTSVVEYVASDAAGHSVTCSFTIVVSDTEAPVISGCPTDILITNDPGNCSAVVTWAAPTADDNCAVNSFTNNFNSGSTFNVGTTAVHYVAADLAGNATTCSFNVVVADLERPVISGCASDISTTNMPGTCAAMVTWVAPTADDNCGVDSFTNNYNSGDSFNVGTTIVAYVAADVAGNSTTCSFNVVVSDVEDPSISGCPADIQTTNVPGSCSAVVIWTAPTADDNCAVDSFISNYDPGDVFNVGTTVVEYAAADAAGHSVTCSFIIVVSDSEAPVISGCPMDISTTNMPGTCAAMVTWVAPTEDDNCGVDSFTNNYNSGDSFNVGTTVVHYVAVDVAGNAATCSFNVVVADAEQPVISGCPADILTTNLPGNCSATVTWMAPTADDNCGVDSFTNNFSSGDTFNVGTTLVVYVAADVAGNSATCSFNVVVADVEDPSISGCPADIATTNDPGNCSAVVIWTAPTADDNCAVDSFISNYDPGDVFNVGTTVVEYAAADAAGHSVTCSFIIVVSDSEAPVISGCPADIAMTNIPGACAAAVTWTAPMADDNCGVDAYTNNIDPGSVFPVGTSVVVYVAADVAGNSTRCSFNVVVSDVEQPVISGCPADIAATNIPGICAAMVTWVAPTADDNCGVDSFTNNYSSGYSFNVGTTVVHYIAADVAGNSTTCSFNVVVSDVEDPSISGCPSDILTTNVPGNCSAVVIWPAPTADDNCAVTSFISTADPGDVFIVGTTVVEYVAADAAGNTSTCSFSVVVTDVEDPVINCPADITVNADYGTNTAVVTFSAPVYDDNCPGAEMNQMAGLSSGSVFLTGTTVNAFTVTDGAGNSANCSFNVTVRDRYPLTLVATNGTIIGATNGLYPPVYVFDLMGVGDDGYVFDSWSLDGLDAGNAPVLTVTSDAPHVVTGNFAAAAWDLNATGTASLVSYRQNPSYPSYLAVFDVCNPAGSAKIYRNKYVLSIDSSLNGRLRYPDGVSPYGDDYADVTIDVAGKLAGVGNGDGFLDPGECIRLNEVEIIIVRRFGPAPSVVGKFYSKSLPDTGNLDTDHDGIPNGWEDGQGLDSHDPVDAGLDQDSDGVVAGDEYTADTNPLDPSSYLRMQSIAPYISGHEVIWIGGTSVLQYLEWTPQLTGGWVTLVTNLPPTPLTNLFDGEMVNREGFYRVRAVRGE